MNVQNIQNVQDTPRGSPPMYFPGQFVLTEARSCAALVDVAYDQYMQWRNAGNPPSSSFNWDRPNNGYTYSDPLFSTFTYYTLLGSGTATEPFGFVAVDANGNAYLVFRGTQTDADGWADLAIDQTAYGIVANYGFVHLGYYEIYQGFNGSISQAIAKLSSLKPFRSFFFTGHSLGCGLSSLAVPDVLANTSVQPGKIAVTHYNFASPRVGDPQFAYMMNKSSVPTYRIVNTEDAVPDAPLAISGFSTFYKHIGTPVDFTAQYDTIDGNHSLDTAYIYALSNTSNPEGPLPPTTLDLDLRPDVRIVMGARLMRLTRPPQAR